MKYIVYLTKNLKSFVRDLHRIYVGVHKTENPEIFDGYIGCGVRINRPSSYMYPKTPFQHAVKKYGVDAFERTVLYIFDTAQEAFKMEEKIVNEHFIKQEHTYNVAIGGLGGSLYAHNPEWYSKKLYQFDITGKLVNIWETTLDACEFYGEPYSRFDWAITDKTIFLNSIWSRKDTINIKEYTSLSKHYTYLYSKDGKLVAEFSSRTECAKALGCDPQSVSSALRNQNTIKGYYVSETLVDKFEVKPRVQIKDATIYVYNKEGKFIGKGIGKEIMNIIDLHAYKSIYNAIYWNKGWYKDYYLSLTPVEEVPEKLHTTHKKINIYDKYGNFIETLESLKETKEKYNLNSAELNRILKGIKKHDNYIFEYCK